MISTIVKMGFATSPKVSLASRFHNIINGELRGENRQVSYGVNPATRDNLWPVPVATKDDLNEAVQAATVAFKMWSQKHIDERKKMVEAFLEEFLKYEDEFTTLLTKEVGKTVRHTEPAA
jgi:acyl-CoA reductase-like NAD-dependent aldehyde dehydrogenase